MKELAKEGHVIPKNQAQPISYAEEETLWQMELLGDSNPEQLINTLIYLIGINFTLCSGEEHKELKTGTLGQLKVHYDYE